MVFTGLEAKHFVPPPDALVTCARFDYGPVIITFQQPTYCLKIQACENKSKLEVMFLSLSPELYFLQLFYTKFFFKFEGGVLCAQRGQIKTSIV